jgi:hypothetical protein
MPPSVGGVVSLGVVPGLVPGTAAASHGSLRCHVRWPVLPLPAWVRSRHTARSPIPAHRVSSRLSDDDILFLKQIGIRGARVEFGEEEIPFEKLRCKLIEVHFRNVTSPLPHFVETFPDDGYMDMYQVMKCFAKSGLLARRSRTMFRN